MLWQETATNSLIITADKGNQECLTSTGPQAGSSSGCCCPDHPLPYHLHLGSSTHDMGGILVISTYKHFLAMLRELMTIVRQAFK